MVPKTCFSVVDNQMVFDRSDTEMIAGRIHKWYPAPLRPIFQRMRNAFVDLYRQASGQMSYCAVHEFEEEKRYYVREGFYANGTRQALKDDCNLVAVIESPDKTLRAKYDSLLAEGAKVIDPGVASRVSPNFTQELCGFEAALNEGQAKYLFGKTRVNDLCVIVADLLGKFGETLFVLSYKFDRQSRSFHVTLAARDSRSYVIYISASDTK